MKEVVITKEPVELYKILKFEGLVASGAEAKALIAGGEVLVDGEVELRKRRKILAGNLISFQGEEFKVVRG